jgi:hypothetical protein
LASGSLHPLVSVYEQTIFREKGHLNKVSELDSPAAKQGLQTILYARAVLNQRDVAQGQFLDRPGALLPVVNRPKGTGAQQFRQSSGIELVGFVTSPDDLSWIADDDSRNIRVDQIVEPGRLGSFLEHDMQGSALALDQVEDRRSFGLDDCFRQNFPRAVEHGNHGHCLVHIHADILDEFHWALLHWVGFRA